MIGGRMRLLAISCRVQVVAPVITRACRLSSAADALGVDRLRRQQYRNTPAMVMPSK